MTDITKSLAVMEDISQGIESEQQVRGGVAYTVRKLPVPYPASSLAEITALDVSKYTLARLFNSNVAVDYIYLPEDNTGAPSTGTGTWVELILNGSGGGGGITEEERVTLAAGQTNVTFQQINTATAAFYLCGDGVDNGRLCEGQDYLTLSSDTIVLNDSSPAGTSVLALENDPISAVDINTQCVARALNVTDAEVISSTSAGTVLDAVLYIYDLVAQTTWAKPISVGAGETILSVSGDQLETTGGTYTLEPIEENDTLSIIARSLNAQNSQVVSAYDTVSILNDVLYIYDPDVETTWVKPDTVGADETIVNVIGGELTTTGGIYTLDTLPTASNAVQVGGDVSELVNDAGYLTEDDLTLGIMPIVAGGASHALSDTDAGACILFDSATAVTLNIPDGLTVGITVMTINKQAGAINVVMTGSEVLIGSATFEDGGMFAVLKIDSSTYASSKGV